MDCRHSITISITIYAGIFLPNSLVLSRCLYKSLKRCRREVLNLIRYIIDLLRWSCLLAAIRELILLIHQGATTPPRVWEYRVILAYTLLRRGMRWRLRELGFLSRFLASTAVIGPPPPWLLLLRYRTLCMVVGQWNVRSLVLEKATRGGSLLINLALWWNLILLDWWFGAACNRWRVKSAHRCFLPLLLRVTSHDGFVERLGTLGAEIPIHAWALLLAKLVVDILYALSAGGWFIWLILILLLYIANQWARKLGPFRWF